MGYIIGIVITQIVLWFMYHEWQRNLFVFLFLFASLVIYIYKKVKYQVNKKINQQKNYNTEYYTVSCYTDCIICNKKVLEQSTKNGKCVACRIQENSWQWQQIIYNQLLNNNLINEEYIWLAFKDGSVPYGKICKPTFLSRDRLSELLFCNYSNEALG